MINLNSRAMWRVLLAVALVFSCSYAKSSNNDESHRFVRGSVLVSTAFPKIQVKLDNAFRYIGKFDFTIQGMAKGERYIFADSKKGKVNRLFIAQFEEILPDSNETYNYSFKDALSLGSHKFRQNTFAFSNRQGKQENPANEGALTVDFLTKKGYFIEDEMMASRFVTVPDIGRKHELIFFYLENISESGHRLAEFYKGEDRTPIWEEISRGLTKRSSGSFIILN